MKLLISTALFLLLCSFTTAYKVVGVKDGDTIVVLDTATKQSFTVRLSEVDCPEKNQAFGTKAKQFTSDLVYGKFVFVKIETTDRYGRSIGKVYYKDSIYLSETLIKNGMAWHYKAYSKSKYLAALETEARKNKVGLWIDSNAIEPSKYRKSK